MLEVANLLPINRGFEATKSKNAWPSFGHAFVLQFAAQPMKTKAKTFEFLPDSHQRFICWWGRLNEGDLQLRGENRVVFKKFQPHIR